MNSDILDAFFSQLDSAALGYPIAWPNVSFDPPDTGVWLEVTHFPNRGIDGSLSGQQIIRQGIFQVSAYGRQNTGVFDIEQAALRVSNVFPKLTQLSDVRVSRVPYLSAAISLDNGKIQLPLTIEYSG